VFVANELTLNELAEAYATLDSDQYYREIRRENLAKIRSACDALERLTAGNSKARILDLGCGNGEFLQELRRRGYEFVAGHEIPETNVDHLRSVGIATYQDVDWSSVPSEGFDVITLLDVAEHVNSPLRLFSECHRILNPGGYLYFHTPVVTKFDRVMHTLAGFPAVGKIGQIWQRGRTSVFHLQNYTDKSLRTVLSSSGFADCHIQTRNELSWPIKRYVRVYLCEKQHLPPRLAPVLAPLIYPLLATNFLNSNKAIATARKPQGACSSDLNCSEHATG
jgi:SAM-dependent methyltransferase